MAQRAVGGEIGALLVAALREAASAASSRAVSPSRIQRTQGGAGAGAAPILCNRVLLLSHRRPGGGAVGTAPVAHRRLDPLGPQRNSDIHLMNSNIVLWRRDQSSELAAVSRTLAGTQSRGVERRPGGSPSTPVVPARSAQRIPICDRRGVACIVLLSCCTRSPSRLEVASAPLAPRQCNRPAPNLRARVEAGFSSSLHRPDQIKTGALRPAPHCLLRPLRSGRC
jgi:hypothetical protein